METERTQYNLQKIKREEARIREAQLLRDEKEKEVQKLRAMQEKALDREAEADEIKAKRAFEETEKQARIKKQQDLSKNQVLKAQLEEARHKQFLEKD